MAAVLAIVFQALNFLHGSAVVSPDAGGAYSPSPAVFSNSLD
jgi:hypothetical protein